MTVRITLITVLLAGIVGSGFSQTISFNTPLPWVSMRNDTMTVRAQIDTSALKGKQLSLTLQTVKNGRSSTIASKTFKITDPSGEFAFGRINKKLVGGEEFIRVKWTVKGTEDKGVIEPIGIADLSAQVNTDTVGAVKLAEDKTAKDAIAAIGDKFNKVGTVSYGVAWNKSGLFIAVKKGSGDETVKFAFDGKTGKNAFLSYPDRMVVCSFADSMEIRGIHFEREMRKDSLVYKELDWRDEITRDVIGDAVVVKVPWFDTGMIPFEARTIGFGAFTEDSKGKPMASMPKNGKDKIPATWGILLLQK